MEVGVHRECTNFETSRTSGIDRNVGSSVRHSEAVPLPGLSPSRVHPLRPWDEWRTLRRAKSLSPLNVPFRF
jgi:hypothetical protein